MPLHFLMLHYYSISYINFRYSEENKLPSPSETRSYNDIIKEAESKIIRAGNYHIGKEKSFV